MKSTALGFLECAYSPLMAGKRWGRRSWLISLFESHTGRRIQPVIDACPGIDFWLNNPTPKVGMTPSDKIPPNYRYMRKIVTDVEPALIINFGTTSAGYAALLAEHNKLPMIWVPHPAARNLPAGVYDKLTYVLNDKLYLEPFKNGEAMKIWPASKGVISCTTLAYSGIYRKQQKAAA